MSSYKCPHCEYYMWEGKEFYECELEQEVSELRSTLQEIKEIAEKYDNLTYPVSSIGLSQEILQKIREVE